ncbi:hypothetical protein [uncultured Alistipes sp.]|uniref:hypothetical protein n=1 Tax=uncultured Alistipes sp. TaxID=538949 RepID=UPI00259992CE|nr:hypothetical protein [uncultured Alistipes sp.]
MLIKSLNTGRILEHAPNQEIVITVDNPLFEDDRMPIAVSTGIEFLLSEVNRTEFGFIDAMMLAPTVQKLPVAIIIAGIEVFIGELQFDEFSDGQLKYTFTEISADDNLTGKIHEIESAQNYDNINMAELVQNAREGRYPDFGLPQIIRKANSAKIEYKTQANDPECSFVDKYANHIDSNCPYIVPAIKVDYLLQKIAPKISISNEIYQFIERLAIIAPYKPEGWRDDQYGVPHTSGRVWSELDIKIFDFRPTEGLPDMTTSDFVKNILKMFCATLFYSNSGYKILNNGSILQEKDFIDWTEKVADSYSVTTGEEGGYSIEYQNEPDTYTPPKVDDLGQAELDDSITTCYNYEEMFHKFQLAEDYINIQIASTRHIYSGKRVEALLYYYRGSDLNTRYHDYKTAMPIIDIVYQAGVEKKAINPKSEGASIFENTIDFNCARCVPTQVSKQRYTSNNSIEVFDARRGMSAVIEFPTVGSDERPTTIYIGLLIGHNFLDQGNYFTLPFSTSGGTEMNNNPLSVAIGGPQGLYERFHKRFAEWYVKKKNSIKAELFLTPADILNLQLWKKRMLYNRLFFIKSIELTLSDEIDIVFANAEFVEA